MFLLVMASFVCKSYVNAPGISLYWYAEAYRLSGKKALVMRLA